jgi:hypothetical protein
MDNRLGIVYTDDFRGQVVGSALSYGLTAKASFVAVEEPLSYGGRGQTDRFQTPDRPGLVEGFLSDL